MQEELHRYQEEKNQRGESPADDVVISVAEKATIDPSFPWLVEVLTTRLNELESANGARHDRVMEEFMERGEQQQERYLGLDRRMIAHDAAEEQRCKTVLSAMRGLKGTLGQT